MSVLATSPTAMASGSKMRSILFASSIGTIIEWYDFLIYATAAALVFNKAVLSDLRSARRHAGRARQLRGRLSGAPARRRTVRPFRRSAWPQIHAGADPVHHGAEHVLHRAAADLCVDRGIGADPVDRAAHHPGHRPRRRMGRRVADGARARAGRPARFLYQLRADRVSDRPGAGHAGVHAGQQIARGGFRQLWLAHSLPGQHRAAGDRDLRAIPGTRDTGIRGAQAARRPVPKSGRRGRRPEHRHIPDRGRTKTLRGVVGLHAQCIRGGLCHHQARHCPSS